MPFDPSSYDTFEFESVEWSSSTNTIALHYGLRDGPKFTEEFRLDGASLAVPGPAKTALRAAIHVLHLCTSTSYFKTAAPAQVSLGDATLCSAERALLAGLLGPGLAEFRYKNRLDPGVVPSIRARVVEKRCGPPLESRDALLVPVGGGKDSIATIEALRRHGHRPVLFVLGGHRRILDVCERTGFDIVVMDRCIDPQLAHLNESGALDGHVPVSAIVSATALIAALCVGAGTIVMSNERSASDPNLVLDGVPVNHQYSKSIDFERLFRRAIHDSVSSSIEYFSLLRGSSELQIAKFFAGLGGYHDVFVSCNHAFGNTGASSARWCAQCPKCRFLFASLAPFLSRERLVEIFGSDLLDDDRQTAGFMALLGVAGWTKPFDCVGEPAETRAALSLAAVHPDWRDAAVLGALRRAVPGTFVDPDTQEVCRLSAEHCIPARFEECARSIS